MLPDGSIEAVHVWKRFRADRRRRLARDHVEQAVSRLRGRARSRWRWALQDVELRADPGESVGLIGVNGSGKSTLLKILTRVMYPYAGRIGVAGRVGALIEVRAGIHPDLTGRENIALYGTLLGLRRSEVAKRFDEIVAFAEIEDAIDRQTKFYSSGMQMRLGFAVAAFLEPDVLLVDEVLAVGDGAFQQKCLERMRHVLAQGTTLVFVSHDLAAVEAACARGVWLHAGRKAAEGPVREVLGAYRAAIEEMAESGWADSGPVRLVKAEIIPVAARADGPLEVRCVVETDAPRVAQLFVGVTDGSPSPIFGLQRDLTLACGQTEVRCTLNRLPLARGRYYLWVGAFASGRDLLPWHPVARFDVAGADLPPSPRGIVRLAPVHVEAHWEVERL